MRETISLVPTWAWRSANNAYGGLREHADVIEVTHLRDLSRWTSSCPGMPVIVRRVLPHPGATLDAFEIRDGYRYQAFTTNTGRGQLAALKADRKRRATKVHPGRPDSARTTHAQRHGCRGYNGLAPADGVDRGTRRNRPRSISTCQLVATEPQVRKPPPDASRGEPANVSLKDLRGDEVQDDIDWPANVSSSSPCVSIGTRLLRGTG